MTVGEMLSRMSSKELTEWMAFASIEPIGESRQDLRIAMLCTLVYNAIKGKGKAAKIDDFVLKFDPPKKQSMEEMQAILKGMM